MDSQDAEGMKVSLKWPSSARLMIQDPARLALWVWVQDKSRLRHGNFFFKSVYLFCSAVQSPPTPPTYPPNRTPNPTATIIKARYLPQLGLFRIAELLLCCGIIFYPCTILLHRLRAILFHFHWCLHEGHQGQAFMHQYGQRSLSQLLANILHPDIWRWDPLLQHLPELEILPKPESLLFFTHYMLQY